MAPRKHRSFRFDPTTLERLERRASASSLTVSALAERYVDEGLRQEDHPGIVFVDGPAGRRASLAGTGLDVWEIVETVRHNRGSTAETAAYLELSEADILSAVGYYADHPYEIDAAIDENVRLATDEEGRQRRVAEALG